MVTKNPAAELYMTLSDIERSHSRSLSLKACISQRAELGHMLFINDY